MTLIQSFVGGSVFRHVGCGKVTLKKGEYPFYTLIRKEPFICRVNKVMDLKEISASYLSPYRCYIHGNIIQTEGENVQTIGFKDGIAVLKVIPPQRDMQKSVDNMLDSKAIDLTKLKKIVVKIDPKTGKKYIHKDGRKIEILPQITNITQMKEEPRSVIVLNKSKLSNMKILETFHMNKEKKSVETITDLNGIDKLLRSDNFEKKHVQTQTDLSVDGRESPFWDTFFNCILGNEMECESAQTRKMIDINRLKTKEDIQKFNFFNDMRNALKFDQSGNLPIHDSVVKNNVKEVKKNCIVLKAIRENVNILNQSCYTSLHLAVLNDVVTEIVKILIQNGADISIADPEGNTAIHLAIEHRRSTMLRLLINGTHQHKLNLNVFNYEGFTPLILAVLSHSYDDAKLLLQKGADPNVKDMKSGRTALFHAAEGHDVNLVQLLMEYKADTKIRNFFGTSSHDAMFELDDIPMKIKLCILGRDHQRFQTKKKLPVVKPPMQTMKKAKLETTPVLKRVSSSEFIGSAKRK